jgi:hypothetical protein
MKSKFGHRIKIEGDDAAEFIHHVNAIMDSLISEYDVSEVVFVKIKNWFDHKWLNYSGKSISHFPRPGVLDSGREESLDNAWLKEITIPPFNPSRVIYSKFIRSEYSENEKITKPMHLFQGSTDNHRRLVSSYTQNGLLIWFSSNTKINQKGSMMVYRSQNSGIATWYAGFENINGWKLSRSKGIDLDEVRRLIS